MKRTYILCDYLQNLQWMREIIMMPILLIVPMRKNIINKKILVKIWHIFEEDFYKFCIVIYYTKYNDIQIKKEQKISQKKIKLTAKKDWGVIVKIKEKKWIQ